MHIKMLKNKANLFKYELNSLGLPIRPLHSHYIFATTGQFGVN